MARGDPAEGSQAAELEGMAAVGWNLEREVLNRE